MPETVKKSNPICDDYIAFEPNMLVSLCYLKYITIALYLVIFVILDFWLFMLFFMFLILFSYFSASFLYVVCPWKCLHKSVINTETILTVPVIQIILFYPYLNYIIWDYNLYLYVIYISNFTYYRRMKHRQMLAPVDLN